MALTIRNKSINCCKLSILVFSFFSAWLISFPYEGQVLYCLANLYKINPDSMVLGAIILHVVGLLSCGFFIKSMRTAKKLMLFDTLLCIAGSIAFFFAPSAVWYVSLCLISFFAGSWMAAWGYYYKHCSVQSERMGTAAGILAYSALIMILVNLMAIYLSPYIGLAAAIFLLHVALFFSLQLPSEMHSETSEPNEPERSSIGIAKPLALLCLFIIIITISAGLMFEVVNPAFENIGWFSSWYWAVPYIAAILVVSRLPKTVNRSCILYVAIAMSGLSFIAFMALDRSAVSYLIINTLLFGACGINDLFWWNILGDMLDFHHNPARVLGIGLSANVLGVLLGELIANIANVSGVTNTTSLIGLTVVCVAIVILPLLHQHLSALLKNHAFLIATLEETQQEQNQTMQSISQTGVLTERENQIMQLLLKGYTYRLIAAKLFLCESTVKTHIQNIYYKLNVKSKTELIQKLIK